MSLKSDIGIWSERLEMVDTTDGVSPGLRVPLQDDLQSIVSQLLTRVNDNNSEAQHVRKQIFSRKFWKR
ncbi:hypothetical protein Aduo_005787 [Ancylostoma duodenale]